MNDYGDDQYGDDSSNYGGNAYDYTSDDDELDVDVLKDFVVPEEDLNGLHIVDDKGEEVKEDDDAGGGVKNKDDDED